MASPDQVGRQIRRGISWNLASAIATNGMRVAVIAVLGRALTSRDFGVVAAAISINVVLYSIRDIGIGRALVQRKELEPGHLTTTFAISTYLGLGLTTLLLVSAPLIGRLYHITASIDVIRALAVLFLMRGVASTSRLVCERAMRFRAIALIDAGTFVSGSIASIVLALEGLGPWALVVGYLVEEGLTTLLYLIISPPVVSLRVDRARLRELMSFGTGQTLTQIAGVLATYGDNFVVGFQLGASALGYYTRAYDLIKLPSVVFEAIVGKVLFPGFSRIQDDYHRLGTVFRRVMFANALVLLPASALLVVVAPEVIRILVGDGWDSSVLPLRILAITVLPRTSQKLGAIVTQAAGRANSVAIAYAVYTLFVIGGAMFSIRWGIPGVATSTALAIIVVYTQSSYLAMKICQLSFGQLFRAHLPGLVLAALVIMITIPVAAGLRSTSDSPVAVVAGAGAVAIVGCLGVVAVLLRRGRGDFVWLSGELRRLRSRAK